MNKSAYTISDIARILEVGGSFSSQSIDTLLLDSRLFSGNLNSLFFAIKSKKNDGHNYISHLYERGLRNFVVSDEFDSTLFPGGNFLKVADPLSALQKLSLSHRHSFKIPVIGITGSNGKTIVKEWLFQLLHSDFNIARSPRSYNSQVGVPLSLWQMKPKHEMAIIECGISEKGEMSKLAEIVAPTIGIFTNIGEAHQENFSSLSEKAAEKAKLFQNCEVVISCFDHPIVREALNGVSIKRNLTWGAKGADLEITQVNRSKEKTELEGDFDGQKSTISIPFIDEASIENACHCWLACLHLGLSPEQISERMSTLSPVAMRLEKRAGIHHSTIINDSYNSDLTSLNIALDFLKMQSKGQEKVLILSDILQSTENPETLYPAIARNLIKRNISKFIGVGRDLSTFKNSFEGIESSFYVSTQEFLDDFDTRQLEHKSVLIKGARHFKFEKIVDRFEQKSHETIMEIDLNKMVDNLNYTRSLLTPSTKIMAMVKASAYGSGSAEIAATLQYNGVEYLAVAYADEGISLRESGITLPILVLNPSSAA
ncbi:MAG: UDP-N-acetylmuramoyl-tripeptide--D-alanyl-D-alanine ligase, partial [Bacteroidota bacterium]